MMATSDGKDQLEGEELKQLGCGAFGAMLFGPIVVLAVVATVWAIVADPDGNGATALALVNLVAWAIGLLGGFVLAVVGLVFVISSLLQRSGRTLSRGLAQIVIGVAMFVGTPLFLPFPLFLGDDPGVLAEESQLVRGSNVLSFENPSVEIPVTLLIDGDPASIDRVQVRIETTLLADTEGTDVNVRRRGEGEGAITLVAALPGRGPIQVDWEIFVYDDPNVAETLIVGEPTS